jgi:hypothetical protein
MSSTGVCLRVSKRSVKARGGRCNKYFLWAGHGPAIYVEFLNKNSKTLGVVMIVSETPFARSSKTPTWGTGQRATVLFRTRGRVL